MIIEDIITHQIFNIDPDKVYEKKVFKGQEMKEHDFSDAYLWDCDFSEANLEGVDFSGTYMRACNFTNANMQGVDFTSIMGINIEFFETDLRRSKGDKMRFRYSEFNSCKLVGADWNGGEIRLSTIKNCIFVGAKTTYLRIPSNDITNSII